MRLWSKHLREDALDRDMKTVSQAKRDIEIALQRCRTLLKNDEAKRHRLLDVERIDIQNNRKKLEADLEKLLPLTVSPPADLPRGLSGRVALRIEGGVAAHHVAMVVCMYPGCRTTDRLAARMSEHTSSV